MRTLLTSLSLAFVLVLAIPAAAFAHVTVTPAEVELGSRTTFVVNVPNEKEAGVNGLRLTIPRGVEDVTPLVHPGWTIFTVKDTAKNVTEIRWEGGTIPVGQSDGFAFQAVAPATKTALTWKAYQTYVDGTTVSWDQKPTGDAHADDDDEATGPYSVTAVTDNPSASGSSAATRTANPATNWAFGLSLAAIVLSVIALTKTRRAASGERPQQPRAH